MKKIIGTLLLLLLFVSMVSTTSAIVAFGREGSTFLNDYSAEKVDEKSLNKPFNLTLKTARIQCFLVDLWENGILMVQASG